MQHGDKAKLTYSDTDACAEHKDIYGWIKRFKTHFELSYSKWQGLNSNTSKHKVGKCKHEVHSQSMIEFVGLIVDIKTLNNTSL
jgi:hypothetical protein